MWMLLTLVYGLIKGSREICKKKALQKNTVMEVLTAYTLMSVLFVLPSIPNAGGLNVTQYLWIALKAFVIFVGWIAGFKAIERLPLGVYGILDLSRVIFATILGVTVLHEAMTVTKGIGMVLVCVGLLLLKFRPKGSEDDVNATDKETGKSFRFYLLLAFISCILNAVSGLLDKVLMKEMNSSQLQFWYILFMAIFYVVYVLITRTHISKTVWVNPWVWLLAILLVIMDKALFIANGMAESQVTIMTLIKQSGVIVAILGGKYIFKEKGTLHKLLCALIIIAGIIFGVIK